MSVRVWSAADQAEFDVLVHAFVEGVYDHCPRCVVCSAGGRWCAHVVEAFEALRTWQRSRALLSRAQALREAQADHEALWLVERLVELGATA